MALSPMMEHYIETKKKNPDCIIFYRLGDFYEMFFEDATLVSKELELTLTGKDCGLDERAPMCGVPYHAADTYISRLVKKGYKVAIAEQLEDPKLAKGLVKRDIVKIVTPGTITSEFGLDETTNNYLMCIAYIGESFGICAVDVSTGELHLTQLNDSKMVLDEINKYSPAELICNHAFEMCGIDLSTYIQRTNISITYLDDNYYSDITANNIIKEHFHISSIEGLGISDYPSGITALGATLRYLYDTQKSSCSQITAVKTYQTDEYMHIDSASRRNLELTISMRDKDKHGTLLWVLDKTKTAMGARLLRSYIEQPLVDVDRINKRLDAIEELTKTYIDREELREYLSAIYDLERLMSRISNTSAGPRELLSFRNSIAMLPHIKNLLNSYKTDDIIDINNRIDPLTDLHELLDNALSEEPPLTTHEGGIIKQGYNEEVDTLRLSKSEGKSWLAELEAKEKDKTGIKGLKIKYNKVFGYYFEVTNSYKSLVPDYYIRKQTLTGSERYTSDELKKLESVILGAEDKLISLEYNLFVELRKAVANEINRIIETAKAIACIDVYASLAVVADKYHYVRPSINTKGIIDIKDGRHPVVERMLNNDMFISNDTYLDENKKRISIITGPNMAGKSTYMRQTALIVLMAQMGSFVPATKANISICDRIFTRVGASDDLASGQSTFMVEMSEVANILRNATSRSLIILDEIGRGTSTFDGLAIAWAVVEYIANKRIIGAKTLFATHYHELTELEGCLDGVNNYCIAVNEQGDDIVFLRKIVKGGADKSYGIQVAKLAGVPEPVIARAKELILELTNADIATRAAEIAKLGIPEKSKSPVARQSEIEALQLSLFDTQKDDDIISEIKDLDLSVLTPIDALNTLYAIQNKIKNRWQKEN